MYFLYCRTLYFNTLFLFQITCRCLHKPPRRGRIRLGPLPQRSPLARRPLVPLHQALPRERGHHHRHPLRRGSRHPHLLQGRLLPRRRLQGPGQGQGTSLPHHLLHRGQDRDDLERHEERLRQPTRQVQGHHSQEDQV